MTAPRAIVIGASAGAVEALTTILPALPADYPLPVMIVVHLPASKDSIMCEVLQNKCALKVEEAEDKEPIQGGKVYLAPPDYHLLVENDGTMSLSADAPILYSRPSIDVLFETAADAYDADLIGIILSGGNNDGSQGLRAVVDAGGDAIVQNPETAYASAMPRSALEACPEAQILDLNQIADYLQKAPYL